MATSLAAARQPPPKPELCPTAWFAALERARLTGDVRLERRALSELRRLGVTVEWRELRQEAARA